jgi:hypothetical protein
MPSSVPSQTGHTAAIYAATHNGSEAGGNAPDGQTSRVGGSDQAPTPAKPGWVWWVTGAIVVMLGFGGFRLRRSSPDAREENESGENEAGENESGENEAGENESGENELGENEPGND